MEANTGRKRSFSEARGGSRGGGRGGGGRGGGGRGGARPQNGRINDTGRPQNGRFNDSGRPQNGRFGDSSKPQNVRYGDSNKPRNGNFRDANKFKTELKEAPLRCTPRSDWHAAELPEVAVVEGSRQPSLVVIEALHDHAKALLESENKTYAATNASSSSSHKFMSTLMTSGTLEDKISALTLMVQESPIHNTKSLENLIGLAKKKSRNGALMAVAALKDMLGQGSVLPDRKLRPFSRQPGVIAALQAVDGLWRVGEKLPGQIQESHLIIWAFEDWLKKQYFDLLKILEGWASDEVEYARSRAITYVWELLRDKPEQEENLLRLLVNKLGDTDKKIASRTSYLLLQLQLSHPAMKTIIIDSIEAECLFRPGQSKHAKYYAIISLNQTILGKGDDALANQLLRIYFSLFLQLLKPDEKTAPGYVKPVNPNQGGGGKAGKMAAKKEKAKEKANIAEIELGEKMIAQVLTGVNRAFPFADTDDPTFEQHMNTIFRVTHSANFNTSIQALMLIQRISSTKHYSADRFYRTLYESLLDPRLLTSSKQIMYLNLLYKSLKSDINIKRVQAFVKRLLQILTLHDPPFICGVLYLISELETTFPSIRSMIKEPEMVFEDEEEHFADVPEDSESRDVSVKAPEVSSTVANQVYDARKRDPEYAHADRSALWDLLPFVAHYHPSVSVFASALTYATPMPPKPDPTHHSLMHFLDRFIYRGAKTKAVATRGSSIMQPLSGSSAADMLITSRDGGRVQAPLNSEAFWKKNIDDVAADEVFFHSYFNQTNKTKPKTKKAQKAAADDSEQEDMEEDEIWNALVNSKPEIEGDEFEDDDDISLGDLESAYDGSDVDMPEGDEGVEIADFPGDEEDEGADEDTAENDMEGDDMFDLDDDEDAMLGDDDDVPSDLENAGEESEDEEAEAKDAKKGKKESANKKRKLKHLPTFASADDYAKMLNDEPDEVY